MHRPAVIVLAWTSLVALPITPPVWPVPWELQLFALTLPHFSTAVTTGAGVMAVDLAVSGSHTLGHWGTHRPESRSQSEGGSKGEAH